MIQHSHWVFFGGRIIHVKHLTQSRHMHETHTRHRGTVLLTRDSTDLGFSKYLFGSKVYLTSMLLWDISFAINKG